MESPIHIMDLRNRTRPPPGHATRVGHAGEANPESANAERAPEE
jgi:hypothetical protein